MICSVINENGAFNGPLGGEAKPGSIVSAYVTGLGPMTPSPTDGTIPPAPTAKPVLPIHAVLGGSPVTPSTPTEGSGSGVPLQVYAGQNPDRLSNAVIVYYK